MASEYEDLNGSQVLAVVSAKNAAKMAPGRHTVPATDGSGDAFAYRADAANADRINWGFKVKTPLRAKIER